jgi:hypothetical protein
MNFLHASDSEVLSIANPIMDNLMDASTNIDHAKHIQNFSARMLAIVTKSYFEDVCKQYQQEKGFFAQRELVAIFRRPNSVAIVWKQTFTKAQGEFVAEMVLIEEAGKMVVDHVMVF